MTPATQNLEYEEKGEKTEITQVENKVEEKVEEAKMTNLA